MLKIPLHHEECTARVAVSSIGIIGPFWLEDENWDVVTINADRYYSIHQSFVRALRRRGHCNDAWFQEEGATPHTTRKVLNFLETNSIVSNINKNGPPHLPDLSPSDYFRGAMSKTRCLDKDWKK